MRTGPGPEEPVETPPPLFVVRGAASAAEVAALVAVLRGAARATAADQQPPEAGSEWSARRRLVRGAPANRMQGAGGWRASALPR